MTVELNPETERLVKEELRRGHFRSVDEVIMQAVHALHEKAVVESGRPRRKLYNLLTQPPFAGSELDLERQVDYARPVDL